MKKTKNDLQQLSLLLINRLDSVLANLFPNKPIVTNGGQIRIGSKGSISIQRNSNHLVWHCFETGEGGDIFKLIQHSLSCDFKSAVAWAKSIVGGLKPVLEPVNKKEVRDKYKNNKLYKVSMARSLWKSSNAPKNTIAESYLKNRGINITLPETIRFHDNIINPTTGMYHPSLVAAIQDIAGKITAIQTISLNPHNGEKITGKGIRSKSFKGAIKGAAIRLSPLSDKLVITEGLEDALSILQCCPDLTVWSGLGGNIRTVQIPIKIRNVVIAADNDEAGGKLAEKLKERLLNEGRFVSIIKPPFGCKDFNECLKKVY
ncbi:MAG: toprim domain-containing protein [Rickettsiales bacterium]|nr:toprim domain-containing protein [Pseudomonadota bacterium]MDA0966555.1 toprim domain-containing protein [Pseudomonadota bacterium]MDG4543584.1 toprim domain-containing protein [Rickettsiales bacterium]MDG4545731.1 toprim domain-containing protein [Rickettsiales bacterium]MDG4547496.1 toprim domain-containing protein [Rickettsiales bacterium]